MLPQSSRQQVESDGALKSLRVWQWQLVGFEGRRQKGTGNACACADGGHVVGLLGGLGEELDEDVGEGLASGQAVEFGDLFADAGDAFLDPLVAPAEA